MPRAICLAVVGLLLSGPLRADENPVEAKLLAAKADFEKAVEQAEDELVAALKAKVASARKAGDLKTLQRAEAEMKAFEDDRTPPKLVPVKEYDADIKAARVKMEAAFVAAVKQHTKDGNREPAEAVQAELDEFKRSGRPRDPFFQGTRWKAKDAKGEVKVEFVIVKRDGDSLAVRYKGPVNTINADAKVKNGLIVWALGDVTKVDRGSPFAAVVRAGPDRDACRVDFTMKDGTKGQVALAREAAK